VWLLAQAVFQKKYGWLNISLQAVKGFAQS
jgi:hypothetical protein